MDAFRAKTALWSVASGSVDADSNFRPIQTNPSCIETCDDEYCPADEDIDYPEWHYEDSLADGPSNWDKINSLCAHEQQSPILIHPDKFEGDGACAVPLDWHVDDTTYAWMVTHKGEGGHTLSVYSEDAKGDVYLENAFQYDGSSQHEKYKFYSLHFHWGPGNQNGSEHVFEGSTTTFEVHFVHYSSDYASLGDAVAAWDTLTATEGQDMHTLGVVGFLFEEVGDDAEYDADADYVLSQFAQDSGMDSVWQNASGSATLSFAITDLVNPSDFESAYYHYWGSLTTPPCTPAVSWHLAQNTIKVRGSTMDAFRARTKEWKTAAGQVDADSNFRPIQSNPSCVYTCSDQTECPAMWINGTDDITYPEWHYKDALADGPSNWFKINSLCADPQQSPILIDPSAFDQDASCFLPVNWRVDDTSYTWTVTHKGEGGHTLSVYSADAKSDVYLENAFGTNGAQHERYKFYSLHFHWGPGNQNGSEHVFEGSTTTFEVHFVHYSSDYESLGDAVAAWDTLSETADQDMHTLGVVGFLFEEVDDVDEYNAGADAVLLQFAEEDAMDSVWQHANGSALLSFAITDFVDPDSFMNSYYHYWGSLTTPPCTPAVSWHLAQNTIKVRGSTMDAFRARTKEWTTAAGHVNANSNFRPIQSNPSCVTTCYADEAEHEWCPSTTTTDSGEEDGSSAIAEQGLDGIPGAVWLAMVLSLLVIAVVFAVLWCRSRASDTESNLAASIETKKEPLSPGKEIDVEIEMQAGPYGNTVGGQTTNT